VEQGDWKDEKEKVGVRGECVRVSGGIGLQNYRWKLPQQDGKQEGRFE
jgi:hypothetical protein